MKKYEIIYEELIDAIDEGSIDEVIKRYEDSKSVLYKALANAIIYAKNMLIDTKKEYNVTKYKYDNLKKECEELESRYNRLSKSIPRLESRYKELDRWIQVYEKVNSLGIDIADLEDMSKLCKRYGIKEILDGMSRYKELLDIKNEFSDIKRKLNDMNKELEELDKQKSDANEVINIYNELKRRGFNIDFLSVIKRLATKYGDVSTVLSVLESYSKISDMNKELNELKKEHRMLLDEIKNKEEEYKHLNVITSIVDDLYSKGFNRKAIESIHNIVKNYDIHYLLKSIENYDHLKKIEDEIEMLNEKRKMLKEEISALTNTLDHLKKEISDINSFIEEEYSKAMISISKDYRGEFEKLYRLKEESMELRGELTLAKIIKEVAARDLDESFEEEIKRLNAKDILSMLRVASLYFKGLNKKVSFTNEQTLLVVSKQGIDLSELLYDISHLRNVD